MKLNGRFLIFTVFLITLTTACKFYFGPDADWSGFTPVFAIALFSGMIIPQRSYSFLLPLSALFISDLLIQFLYTEGLFPYAGFYGGQWKNYTILLLSTLIGWALQGKKYSSIAFGSVAAPTAFFLVSNLSVWMGAQTLYARDWSGLMTCYAAALPFYKNALLSTLIFIPVILLSYNLMTRQKRQFTLA